MWDSTTSKYGHWLRRTQVQTGTYTVGTRDFGTVITNRGGTTSTYTLPAPGPEIAGIWVQFYRVAAGDMSVTAGTDKIVAANDATATSVGFTGDNEEIGQSLTMVCDGTSWLAIVDLAAEATGVTIT